MGFHWNGAAWGSFWRLRERAYGASGSAHAPISSVLSPSSARLPRANDWVRKGKMYLSSCYGTGSLFFSVPALIFRRLKAQSGVPYRLLATWSGYFSEYIKGWDIRFLHVCYSLLCPGSSTRQPRESFVTCMETCPGAFLAPFHILVTDSSQSCSNSQSA